MLNSVFTPKDLTVSKLRFYSTGIVAENKELSSSFIYATPLEELSSLDGEVTAKVDTFTATGKDALEGSFTASVNASVTLKADWLPIAGSNRLTAPDVRRGESVMIYQFGDSDAFFWTTLKQDSRLRRLETVIFAFSATKNEVDKLDSTNSYFLEISTHTKTCTFHTSSANGEPFEYTVQINTAEGSVNIVDDIGNEFILDSAASRVFMKNSSGSVVDINKKSIILTSDSSVKINTKEFLVSAGSIATIQTPTFSAQADKTSVSGSFHGKGSGVFEGSITLKAVNAEEVLAASFTRKDGAKVD